MQPIIFEIPLPGGLHLPVNAYGAMLALGFLLALVVAGGRERQLGLDRSQVFNLGYLAIVCGLVGAHLLHVVLYPEVYFAASSGGGFSFSLAGLGRSISLWQGGLVYYGGLAGGMVALLLYARWKEIPGLDLLDLVAPLGALALAVTRVGCFLNGCCFGRPTELPWAVSYPPGSLPQIAHWRLGLVGSDEASLSVHPSQLYELVAALLIFAVLWKLYPARRFAGQITLTFLLLYASWRFSSEFFRGDDPGWAPGSAAAVTDPLNDFQWLSLLVFGLGTLGLILTIRYRRPPFATPETH